MEPANSYRPRVSRETRLLLTAGVLAIVALWLLARIRFRDLPTAGPLPAVLSQLTPGPRYDDLAAEIANLHQRLNGLLIVLDGSVAAVAPERSPGIVALRYRDDLALTVLPGGARSADASVIATDPATDLTVIRVKAQPSVALGPSWTPSRPERPRYFVVADATPAGVSLEPAFVGALASVTSAAWPAAIWAVPARSHLSPGSFVFTSSGEFAGLVTTYGAERAIVPGATLFAEAERLLSRPMRTAGTIGVEVQGLTASIAAATGAASGVVATWVDPAGPASTLVVGDVIEAVDQRPVSRDEWEARVSRLSAGQTLFLRVRSRGQVREVEIAAAPVPQPPALRSLGLTLRQRRRVGAEVVRVEPGSAAARAGLSAGDVITLIADVQAPTPAQVTRSFSSMPDGRPIVVGVTRGDAHFVTTVEH